VGDLSDKTDLSCNVYAQVGCIILWSNAVIAAAVCFMCSVQCSAARLICAACATC
jgi:hypothetical protein